MRKLILILTALCTLLLSSCRGGIVVGILTTDASQQSEAAAFEQLMKSYKDIRTVQISAPDQLKSIDVLWYQRLDTCAISASELAYKQDIKTYLAQGGQMVLSMDAVRLLNEWGIEPQPIEIYSYECVDEGYGRKLGFHAYRSHPIFDKMYGGAYPWHGEQDNVCRLLGFTGKNMPKAEGTQIVATQWEYIFNRPDKKIIWQTPVGKGRVLAIGGCLYYNRANFHTAQLSQFTANVIRYLGGAATEDIERYWDYTPATVQQFPNNIDGDFSAVYSPIEPPTPKPQTLALTEPRYSLMREAQDQYATLSTPHAMIIAQERGGIDEIWTHPVMSVRDFRTFLYIDGEKQLIPLSSCPNSFELHPHAIVRRYSYKDLTITETLTSDIESSTAVVNYAWSGSGLKSIITDFKSNLRYMWPYDADALGSIYYTWSPSLNALVVKDKGGEFCSIVGGNMTARVMNMGQFGDISYPDGEATGSDTKLLQVAASLIYDVQYVDALDIVLAANAESENKALAQYAAALREPAAIAERSAAYYSDYLGKLTTLNSPDPAFNEALRWAQISAAQFLVETPGLGRGLMAGYSSSRRGWGGGHRVSGRPGYAWYFGRDAAWASLAFDAMGDFETVRSSLQLMIDHQEIDGKIYHELTSSGFTHFDASDSTPLMVILMEHYLRSSGDLAFVKANYDAIRKAMDYCYSTDYDGDGIIEINHVGHGWLEGGLLFGSQTEFYLAGTWRKALQSAAAIAQACGRGSDARKYSNDAANLDEAMEGFWNDANGYYNYALNEDDSYTSDFISLTAVPVYFQTIDSKRAQLMSKLYAGPTMSTDWGIRTSLEDANHGEYGAYAPRHVWPLFTGWATLAQYKTSYYNQGFATLANNLSNYQGFALGRIAEVINGDEYRNNGITCHQCWSETMAILPAIEGMLGFEPNAPEASAKLSPALPFDWDKFSAANLYIGKTTLSLEMSKSEGVQTYTLASSGKLSIDFAPIFPAMAEIESVSINGVECKYSTSEDNGYVKLSLSTVVDEEAVIEIRYKDGVSALPALLKHEAMKPSTGFRVLDQKIENGKLVIELSAKPASKHKLRLYIPGGCKDVQGVESIGSDDGIVYDATVQFDVSQKLYETKVVVVDCLLR